MESALDPSICPACGAPNSCGMSQGKTACWCFGVSIPQAALERIPAEAKDRACLCPRCAALAEPEVSGTPNAQPVVAPE